MPEQNPLPFPEPPARPATAGTPAAPVDAPAARAPAAASERVRLLLLRGHPDPAVHADDLTVHVGVGQALHDHRGQLVGHPEPLGEEHRLAELGLERLGVLALAATLLLAAAGIEAVLIARR